MTARGCGFFHGSRHTIISANNASESIYRQMFMDKGLSLIALKLSRVFRVPREVSATRNRPIDAVQQRHIRGELGRREICVPVRKQEGDAFGVQRRQR